MRRTRSRRRPAPRSATAHRAALSWKNGSSPPATRYVRGIERGITLTMRPDRSSLRLTGVGGDGEREPGIIASEVVVVEVFDYLAA